jgi:polysaccharide deacetylase 2 family uncharacterized protein YibQ
LAVDDLSAPLGRNKAGKRKLALPAVVPWAVAGVLGLSVLVFAGWAMIAEDPLGGEPVAVASADLSAAGATSEGTRATATQTLDRPNRHDGMPAQSASPASTPQNTITIIDGTSGKRQEVVIAGPAPENKSADNRLTETSRHGPIPRIAKDGSRPSEVYARPVKPIAGKPNAPRIAIVVGGLGVSATNTSDAIGRLPAAVTLAFAPYGAAVEQQAARARAGHEILLQVPMEPFDYPDNDPGPQTLLTSIDPGQNIDRLQWLMSRFQGYVGISNYMGARFTASEQALSPALKEIGKRGLIYLDDGSSQRSLATQIAGINNIAFAKADVALDAVPTAADIDRALGRLERIARERGSAIGVAGALPASIERIAKWAKGAEGRGVLLVPISALANRAKSS